MVQITLETPLDELIDPDSLRRAAQATLEQQAVTPEADLTVVVTGDARMRQLNRTFRNQNASTDVLAFPAGQVDPDSGQPYLGDVILSWPRAREQALGAGHSPGVELQLLTVHGILHLLGHDHQDPEAKDRMWSAQAEILAGLGISPLAMP